MSIATRPTTVRGRLRAIRRHFQQWLGDAMGRFHVVQTNGQSILGIWHHSSFVINLVQLFYLFYSVSTFPFKHEVVSYKLSHRNNRSTCFHETYVLCIWKHVPNWSYYARRNRHAVSFSQRTVHEVGEDAIKLSPHCVNRDKSAIIIHWHVPGLGGSKTEKLILREPKRTLNI